MAAAATDILSSLGVGARITLATPAGAVRVTTINGVDALTAGGGDPTVFTIGLYEPAGAPGTCAATTWFAGNAFVGVGYAHGGLSFPLMLSPAPALLILDAAPGAAAVTVRCGTPDVDNGPLSFDAWGPPNNYPGQWVQRVDGPTPYFGIGYETPADTSFVIQEIV